MKIKLIKSGIGERPKVRATLRSLGLTKLNKVVEKPDNAQIRGMVNRVRHLVKILD